MLPHNGVNGNTLLGAPLTHFPENPISSLQHDLDQGRLTLFGRSYSGPRGFSFHLPDSTFEVSIQERLQVACYSKERDFESFLPGFVRIPPEHKPSNAIEVPHTRRRRGFSIGVACDISNLKPNVSLSIRDNEPLCWDLLNAKTHIAQALHCLGERIPAVLTISTPRVLSHHSSDTSIEKMPRADIVHECPSCSKLFRKRGHLASHLTQTSACRWVLEARAATEADPDLDLSSPPLPANTSPSSAGEYYRPNGYDPDFDIFPPPIPPSPIPVRQEPIPPPQSPTPDAGDEQSAPSQNPEREPVAEKPKAITKHTTAGRVYGRSDVVRRETEALRTSKAPFAPFANRIDWEIAKWTKDSQTGDNKLDRLLGIRGVVESLGLSFKNARALNQIIDHELPNLAEWTATVMELFTKTNTTYDMYSRDILKCIRVLYGNPVFAEDMAYAPEKHFSDVRMIHRMFSEMHICDWWNEVQEELPEGSTVVPVIFATDKTQVTQFNGSTSMYPLYMTIGNITKAIHRQPSRHAWILVAYLPTAKLNNLSLTKLEAKVARARLFHKCMRVVVAPLIEAGQKGVMMAGGDGDIRCCYPIVALCVGDHPEQCLVTCTRSGVVCACCGLVVAEYGEHVCKAPRDSLETLEALERATSLSSLNQANTALKPLGLNPISEPFWKDLPHCNIHKSIGPDILHQGYQGVLKTLVQWLQKIVGETELDARFKRLPFMHGVRSFTEGISGLSHITGGEHKNICKQILGCIVGIAPDEAVRATVALLDFFYLAQYHMHTEASFKAMEKALDEFHKNKQIFVTTGARDVNGDDFNLPKLHFLEHYVYFIRRYGTTDNYNTEATERLHIDLVKDAFRATNHKDHVEQMVRWLSRREKVNVFSERVAWAVEQETERLDAKNKKRRKKRKPQSKPRVELAEQPSSSNVSIPTLTHDYGATHFTSALQTFIGTHRSPTCSGYMAQESDSSIRIPFNSVDVWHRIKFHSPSIQTTAPDTDDIADAIPARYNKARRVIQHARFDTVLVNGGMAQKSGIKGTKKLFKLAMSFS
ncbi:hypothetical protein NLI96_g10232 [Meripilus lineatus]|uniref:C2H2-type domain-containing protein n=1 Tax=Meripilus lineatus TaxID=2056292 RepID=A0AAD5UU04_9APHY|nr:hypothetical protein NLI96_g10232 [Physisporinus lineatus]